MHLIGCIQQFTLNAFLRKNHDLKIQTKNAQMHHKFDPFVWYSNDKQ